MPSLLGRQGGCARPMLAVVGCVLSLLSLPGRGAAQEPAGSESEARLLPRLRRNTDASRN